MIRALGINKRALGINKRAWKPAVEYEWVLGRDRCSKHFGAEDVNWPAGVENGGVRASQKPLVLFFWQCSNGVRASASLRGIILGLQFYQHELCRPSSALWYFVVAGLWCLHPGEGACVLQPLKPLFSFNHRCSWSPSSFFSFQQADFSSLALKTERTWRSRYV